MKKSLSLLGMFFTVILFQNCDEQVTDPTLDPPTEEEIAEAEQLVDSANTLLFNELLNELGPDISTVDSLYDKALELDPNNKDAHFGKAFMEIALISQDEDLLEAFNSWSACSLFSDTDFFPENSNGISRSIINNSKSMVGIPQSIQESLSFDPLQVLHYLPIIRTHEQILNRNINNCPDISDIQDLLEVEFLSRISSAIAHFEIVLGSGFVFEITGEMMGDESQDMQPIDDAAIYLMKAYMHQMRAMMYAIITYNINIPYYSENPESDMIALLAQESNFLTIRSGQGNSWPNAHDDLNKVVDSIESALTFLQENSTASNQLENDDIVEITEAIDQLRMLLNQDINLSCESEGPCAMTLNISNFLNNPPQNMKNILPDYNLQMGTCLQDGQQVQCLEFSWVATSCDSWKEGWDVTIGGLFPNMTPEVIFSDLSPEDCTDILNMDF
jgi:hypothetical protein